METRSCTGTCRPADRGRAARCRGADVAASRQRKAARRPLRSTSSSQPGVGVDPLGRLVVVVLHLVLVAARPGDRACPSAGRSRRRDPRCALSTKMSLPLTCSVTSAFCRRSFSLQLLDRQQHGDVDHLIEVARDAVQLGEHVLSQSRRDFEVMTADRQIHEMILSGVRQDDGSRGGRSAGIRGQGSLQTRDATQSSAVARCSRPLGARRRCDNRAAFESRLGRSHLGAVRQRAPRRPSVGHRLVTLGDRPLRRADPARRSAAC